MRTLGAFHVWRGDALIPAQAWKHRTALALFACVLGAPGQRIHRERLADFLWPEASAVRAAGNLRLTVHRLRKLLADRADSDGYVRMDGDCRAPDCSCCSGACTTYMATTGARQHPLPSTGIRNVKTYESPGPAC